MLSGKITHPPSSRHLNEMEAALNDNYTTISMPFSKKARLFVENKRCVIEVNDQPLASTSTLNLNYNHVSRDRYTHVLNKPFFKRPISKVKAKKGFPLVRVIQMSPPTLVTTRPEDFRSVVQKLTGSPSSSPKSSSSASSSCRDSTQTTMRMTSSHHRASSIDISRGFQNTKLPLVMQRESRADEEADDDFVLLSTDHDSTGGNDNATYDAFKRRLNSSHHKPGVFATSHENSGHDILDSAAPHSTASDHAAPSSISPRFSMAACFEGLEGLPDPFEAQSASKPSSSTNDPQCSYTMYNDDNCPWNLGAVEDFFQAMDEVAVDQGRPSESASSNSSLQSYNGDGYCQLITS